MCTLRSLARRTMACGIVAAVFCGLGPAVATAQSVYGFGEVPNGDGLSPSEISIDAWIDDNGVSQGTITFIGDVFRLRPTGLADPWIMEVTDIIFDGNTAYVTAVVVQSVFPTDIGTELEFSFTDNSATGEPDEIDGTPIVAGNITVTD